MTEEFHLSVSTQMKEVNTKILAAPKIQYNKLMRDVQNGTWSPQNIQFKKAASLKKHTWTVLVLQEFTRTHYVENFMRNLVMNGNVYEK